jgi:hypothetical protein
MEALRALKRQLSDVVYRRLLADHPQSCTGTYADGVRILNRQLQRTLEAGYQGARDVLLYAAHLHIHDAKLGGTERTVHVSEHYATRVEALPPVFDAFPSLRNPSVARVLTAA